jgi:hypothetical protein
MAMDHTLALINGGVIRLDADLACQNNQISHKLRILPQRKGGGTVSDGYPEV